MLDLEVIDSTGGDSRTIPVGAGGIAIGRDASVALRLSDPEISSVHCRIEQDGCDWRLTDSSTNGTWLNGAALTREAAVPLRAGDELALGRYRIRVSERTTPQPAADPWATARPAPAPRAADWTPPERTAPPRGIEAGSGWSTQTQTKTPPAPLDHDALNAALLTGLVMLLDLRARERTEAGVPRRAGDPGALLAGASNAVAARERLASHPAPTEAVAAMFAALRDHEAAKLGALQAAFRSALGELAPAKLAAAGNDAARWQAYCSAFGDAGGADGIADRLARTFAEALAKTD